MQCKGPIAKGDGNGNIGKMQAGKKEYALVTGAGGGLGREVAVELAGRGCAVAVLDIKRETAEETAGLCRAAGADASTLVDDLTRAGAPEEAVDTVVHAWGRL